MVKKVDILKTEYFSPSKINAKNLAANNPFPITEVIQMRFPLFLHSFCAAFQ